jgi:hypothetical protein
VVQSVVAAALRRHLAIPQARDRRYGATLYHCLEAGDNDAFQTEAVRCTLAMLVAF